MEYTLEIKITQNATYEEPEKQLLQALFTLEDFHGDIPNQISQGILEVLKKL